MKDIFYVRFRVLFFGLDRRILCYIVGFCGQKAAQSPSFGVGASCVTFQRHLGATGTVISQSLRISRETLCFGPNFCLRHAVDYIGACLQISTNTRFSRVLSPPMCYSFSALNTSVVLCGLW
jgi:hypothetical protein